MVENSIAVAATSVTRKHQAGRALRVRGVRTGTTAGSATRLADMAPPTGMRRRTSAATVASTAVTATAGRQPHPIATQAPTASGPSSPTEDPMPLPSVRAADALPPWCIARPACEPLIATLAPSASRNIPPRLHIRDGASTRADTPTAMRAQAMTIAARRPRAGTSRGVANAAATPPIAMAVPCSPACASLIPSSSASSGTLGLKL